MPDNSATTGGNGFGHNSKIVRRNRALNRTAKVETETLWIRCPWVIIKNVECGTFSRWRAVLPAPGNETLNGGCQAGLWANMFKGGHLRFGKIHYTDVIWFIIVDRHQLSFQLG